MSALPSPALSARSALALQPPAIAPALSETLLAPALPVPEPPFPAAPEEQQRPLPLLQSPSAAVRVAEPGLTRVAPAPDLVLPSASPVPELAGRPAAPVTALPAADSRGVNVDLDGVSSVARRAPPTATAAPPVALPASAAQPTRRLDLNLSRAAAVQRSGGVLALLPPPPPREDKLAREIEKAGKPDCSKAHAGAGLLAVVPLVLDALGKDSCKW